MELRKGRCHADTAETSDDVTALEYGKRTFSSSAHSGRFWRDNSGWILTDWNLLATRCEVCNTLDTQYAIECDATMTIIRLISSLSSSTHQSMALCNLINFYLLAVKHHRIHRANAMKRWYKRKKKPDDAFGSDGSENQARWCEIYEWNTFDVIEKKMFTLRRRMTKISKHLFVTSERSHWWWSFSFSNFGEKKLVEIELNRSPKPSLFPLSI